jgi:hypothetical protein
MRRRKVICPVLVTPLTVTVREEVAVLRRGVAPRTAANVMFPVTPVEEQILFALVAKVTMTFPIVGREARADSNARDDAVEGMVEVVAPRNFNANEPPVALHANS